MTLESFEARHFQAKTAAMIDHANSIIAEYQARGFTLTLRQLYYQFVARSLIDNKQSEYKRLGDVIKNGRRAGLIDWEAIEDRTRNMRDHPSWDSPAGLVAAAAEQYREDLWLGQDFRLEVWIEKDALLGVIERVCDDYRVPYFACRGNNSDAEKFGVECWELDALDPAVIAELIRREVEGMIDVDAWNAARDEEAANRALLEAASGNWASVENFLGGDR